MSATRQSGQALIFDAIRTPRGRGKSNGALHGTKPIDLAVGLIEEIQVWNPNLDPALIDEFGRKGRSTGAGFYEYADGKRVGLWSGLEMFRRDGAHTEIPFEDIKERMLFIEAVETVRCLEEGVLESTTDANVGSILGIGYPGWTGGVARYIDQYAGGIQGFVSRAQLLAARYGDRFLPPQLLLDKAAAGGTFEEVN